MMLSAAFACSGLEVMVAIDPAPIMNEESALFDHSLRLSMVSSLLSARRCDDEARDVMAFWLHRYDDEKAEISRLHKSATQKSSAKRVVNNIIILSFIDFVGPVMRG
jgi:hypothetical protein